jgi:pimeloyl-ACP methyl ester carboxylesterase
MVACEVAAAYPRRASRLALIAPLGFWRDADPVVNWALLTPDALRTRLFHDPDGEAARRMFGPDGGADGGVEARVRLTWAMGATGKFIWPIPDKGLGKRIHRVTAPTVLVWGKEDRLVPPVYADEFTRRLPGARVETVDRSGHAPHWEQPEAVARLVHEFLR